MRALFCLLPIASLFMTALPAHADWSLDNGGSALNFVTIKAQDVAEVHTFRELSGSVTGEGRAVVTIELASVDTLIPIRDERLQQILFKTEMFPTATVSTQLDLAGIQNMPLGASTQLTAELVLSLGGQTLPITTDLLVSRLSGDRFLVATLKPLIVNAGSVALADAVEQLREIAGLPSISKAVPVTFVLQFSANR